MAMECLSRPWRRDHVLAFLVKRHGGVLEACGCKGMDEYGLQCGSVYVRVMYRVRKSHYHVFLGILAPGQATPKIFC